MVIKHLLSLFLAVTLIQGSEFKSSISHSAQSLNKDSFDSEPPPSRLLTPSIINCPPGQSTNSDGTSCVNCGSQCAYCADFDQACLRWLDYYIMEINPSNKTECLCKSPQKFSVVKKICQCPANKWFNGSSCQAESSCATGEYSNKGTCESCVTIKKIIAKAIVKKKANSCCADSKYLNSDSLCQECPTNCKICADTTGDYLECNKKIVMKEAKADLKKLPSCCADKQYYNSALTPKRQNCPENCKICKDENGYCIKWNKGAKLSKLKIKVKKTSCCKEDNNYWSIDSKRCESCKDSQCRMCKDVTAECIDCGRKVTGHFSRVNIRDCCDRGKYHVADGGCEPCQDKNCDVCENITGDCLECSKKIVVKAAKVDIKKLPRCCGDNQYYNSALTTIPKCQNCVENCRICNDDDDGTCIRCSNYPSLDWKKIVQI